MERGAFKQFAALEADHWWFIGRRGCYIPLLADVLERDLGRPPTDLDVADVGCGVGGFLGPLERFGRVTGLELDEPSIAWCRDRGHPRTAVGLSDALPLGHRSVDLLTLWDVLEHTADDRAVLAELYQTLRPGGHVALSLPAYPFLFADNDRVARHFRRYTRRDIVAKLREAGFEVRKATYVNVALSPVIIPAVLMLKLKERLVPAAGAPSTNLSFRLPRPVNGLLARVFAAEHRVLRHVSAPFGHSLFAVGRRPPGS